jgi:hypothetical protein
MFLIALFVTAGTYRGVFLSGRVSLAGVAIGAYDLMWIIVAGKALVARRREFGEVEFMPGFRLVRFAFGSLLAGSVIAFLVGVVSDASLASAVKLPRTVGLLLIPFIVVRRVSVDRNSVLVTIVAGGAVSAILQVATFPFAQRGVNLWALLGVTYSDSGLAGFAANPTAIGLVRDVGVSVSFIVIGLLIMMSSFTSNEPVVRRQGPAVMISVLCGIGVLLSLTRSPYVGVGIGTLAILSAAGAAGAIRSARRVAMAGVGLAIVGLLAGAPGPERTGATQIVLSRLAAIGQVPAEDPGLGRRSVESGAALDRISGHVVLGRGEATIFVPGGPGYGIGSTDTLHNAYLHYLLAGGLVTLAPLVLLLSSLAFGAWRWRRRRTTDATRLLATATFAVVLATVAMSLVGGILNDPYFTPIFGALISLTVAHRPPYVVVTAEPDDRRAGAGNVYPVISRAATQRFAL